MIASISAPAAAGVHRGRVEDRVCPAKRIRGSAGAGLTETVGQLLERDEQARRDIVIERGQNLVDRVLTSWRSTGSPTPD